MAQNVQQWQPQPQKSSPKQRSKTLPAKRIRYAKTPWKNEIKHIICAILITMCFGVISVWLSNQANLLNEASQANATQLENYRNKNNDTKEQISNLTTQQRLNEIAQKAGMSLENNNIKNVK